MTRKYPGMLVLPGWLKAFGWPVLLILSGLGLFALEFVVGVVVSFKLPAFLVGVGVVFFIAKLATNGEEL